jgi:hypothetical protein
MKRYGKIPTEILRFDIIAYLQDRNIPISFQSRHTSEGYINIQCPFCHDPSDHLGINVATKISNCWLCGGKSISRIVAALEGGCSYAEANTVIRSFGGSNFGFDLLPSLQTQTRNNRIIPSDAVEDLTLWPKAHCDYLLRRRFDPTVVVPKYGLYAIAQSVNYSWRIIIPIWQGEYIMSFAAMDITGKREPKYLACPASKSILPAKDTVYNINTVENTMLIVEGYTDTWRVGDGAVAVMGMQFTPMQLQIIADKAPHRIFVLFDGEDPTDPKFTQKHKRSLGQAKKLAFSLKGIVSNVEVIEMSHNDPGDLTDEEVLELRAFVFG